MYPKPQMDRLRAILSGIPPNRTEPGLFGIGAIGVAIRFQSYGPTMDIGVAMLEVERIDGEGLHAFLPPLERRLTEVEPESFSLESILGKVKQLFNVHTDHMRLMGDFLKSGYLRLYAAKLGEKYVGYTSCMVQPKPNFLLCFYVDEIWVAEEHRNQGVASALLGASVDATLKTDITKVMWRSSVQREYFKASTRRVRRQQTTYSSAPTTGSVGFR